MRTEVQFRVILEERDMQLARANHGLVIPVPPGTPSIVEVVLFAVDGAEVARAGDGNKESVARSLPATEVLREASRSVGMKA